ncbi:hypothetical protein CONLIGDRAFT_648120 [Coniochaeta ligniaria NRRL 30616]|uniref:Uncharacterized protein n=1 Tax=Coniochaeta ligniaria NRRL 30616 TaxID=1408157 RepID=A0A1J7ICP9_9PEZI|nr:hypothetical protein CONLIGDRAFT_648120 [Coniochaeta ligniaria NRRL 30616]
MSISNDEHGKIELAAGSSTVNRGVLGQSRFEYDSDDLGVCCRVSAKVCPDWIGWPTFSTFQGTESDKLALADGTGVTWERNIPAVNREANILTPIRRSELPEAVGPKDSLTPYSEWCRHYTVPQYTSRGYRAPVKSVKVREHPYLMLSLAERRKTR